MIRRPPDQRFHVGPIVAHAKTLIEGTLEFGQRALQQAEQHRVDR